MSTMRVLTKSFDSRRDANGHESVTPKSPESERMVKFFVDMSEKYVEKLAKISRRLSSFNFQEKWAQEISGKSSTNSTRVSEIKHGTTRDRQQRNVMTIMSCCMTKEKAHEKAHILRLSGQQWLVATHPFDLPHTPKTIQKGQCGSVLAFFPKNWRIGCCFAPPSCRKEIRAFLSGMTCVKLTKTD